MDKVAVLEMAERIKSGISIKLPPELRKASRELAQIQCTYEESFIAGMHRDMDYYTFLLHTLVKPSQEGVKAVIEEGLKRNFTKSQIHLYITMRLEDDRRGKKFIPKLEDM